MVNDRAGLQWVLEQQEELVVKPGKLTKDDTTRTALLVSMRKALEEGAVLRDLQKDQANEQAAALGLPMTHFERPLPAKLEEARAWSNFLRTGEIEKRDQSVGDNAGTGPDFLPGTMGSFVPRTFLQGVTASLKQYDALFDPSVTTWIETDSGNPMQVGLMSDTQSVAQVVSPENSDQSGNELDIASAGSVDLRAFSYRTPMWRLSIEAAQDLQQLTTSLDLFKTFSARRVAAGVAADCVNGNGSGRPLGLITSLLALGVTGIVATGSSESTGGAQTGSNSIGYSDLINLTNSVDPMYAAQGSFLMNWQTFSSISRILDKYGRPLRIFTWQDGKYYFQGRPVLISPSMPYITNAATTVIFGDLSFFAIRHAAKGDRVQVIREAPGLAEKGEIGLRTWARYDCALLFDSVNPAATCSLVSDPTYLRKSVAPSHAPGEISGAFSFAAVAPVGNAMQTETANFGGWQAPSFDRHQFAGKRTKAVSIASRLSFSDFTHGMHVQRRRTKQIRRLPDPEWVANTKDLQRVVLAFCENSLYIARKGYPFDETKPASERLKAIERMAAVCLAGEKKVLHTLIERHYQEQQSGMIPAKLQRLELMIANVDSRIMILPKLAAVVASVFYLFYCLGYDSVEVAEHLGGGLTPVCVRQMCFRARIIWSRLNGGELHKLPNGEFVKMTPTSKQRSYFHAFEKAQKLGITVAEYRGDLPDSALIKTSTRWPRTRLEKIYKLYMAKKTWTEIGAELGTHRSNVCRLGKSHLKLPDQGRTPHRRRIRSDEERRAIHERSCKRYEATPFGKARRKAYSHDYRKAAPRGMTVKEYREKLIEEPARILSVNPKTVRSRKSYHKRQALRHAV